MLKEAFIHEYMMNTYSNLEKDLQRVKNRISLYGLSSDDYYDLLVCEIRLDTASSLFRQIREILQCDF